MVYIYIYNHWSPINWVWGTFTHSLRHMHIHSQAYLPHTPAPKAVQTVRQTHTQKCHLLSWKETTFSCISRTLTSFFWRCSSFWKASLLAFFSARLSWKIRRRRKRISRAPIYRTRWDTGIYTYRLIMHRQTYRHMCASSYTIGNAVTTDTWQQLFLLVIWTHVPSLCADCIIPCMQFGTPWLGRSTAATSAATPSPAHVFDVSLFKTVFSFFLFYCGAQQKIYEIYSAKVFDNIAILPFQAAHAHFPFSSSEKVLAWHKEAGFKHDNWHHTNPLGMLMPGETGQGYSMMSWGLGMGYACILNHDKTNLKQNEAQSTSAESTHKGVN